MPLAALRDALRLAPDPADAARRLDRLCERGLDDAALTAAGEHALAVVRIACEKAPYLAELLGRDPRRLAQVASDPHLRREKPREVMARELAALVAGVAPGDEAGLHAGLRAYRGREMVRLGARECGLGHPEEVGRELAHLADVCFDAALAWHDAELERQFGPPFYLGDDGAFARARLCVIGMGKMGGEELNFSSDVDVIYLYPSDEGQAGSLSLHEYFDKLARRVTRAVGEATEDEWVFRVDLRLRPEGTRGPLVNSLPSLERYYESWGRPWERQAWLKARPSAGDLALGAAALRLLEPFVFPRHTSEDLIAQVNELNRKIKAEHDTGALGRGFDVKLGRGGIREVEFFVQALQLLHAGKRPELRVRPTRHALDRLLLAGLVAERERALLHDAYEFLRQVEHLLQLESGAQTARLPGEVARLQVLAGRLGLADAGELKGRLELHTDAVAHLFATLGEPPETPPAIAVLLDADRSEDDTRAALASLGFSDADQARLHLELLRKRPLSPFSPAAPIERARLAPALLEEVAASPDPDQALAYLVDLAARSAAGMVLWPLLDENPALRRLTISLLGTSAFLARRLVERPDLVDVLLAPVPAETPAELAARVDQRLGAVDPDDSEGTWIELRRVHGEELLAIGLADVAGRLDVDEVGERLTDLADVCVDRTLAQVSATLARRHPDLPPIAVLGLGKLGSRELGYGSDLDLAFVYQGDVEAHEPASRLAQRLVSALGAHVEGGRLYEVDTRLRPSGRQGTLVVSLTGWVQYQAESARLWERQALTRLRAVAGDPALGAAVEAAAARAVYEGPRLPAAQLVEELAGMRARMEKELAHEAPGTYDLKTGRGGLVDVEFGAQLLQLRFGPDEPRLRVRGTIAVLDAARAAGLVDETLHAGLTGGWRFLRRLEHRMRIVHDRAVHELPSGAELAKLARRMGFASAGALERQYLVWTREVRACYVKLLELAAR